MYTTFFSDIAVLLGMASSYLNEKAQCVQLDSKAYLW